MKIQPATLDQVAIGRNGKRIAIDADVGSVAQQLQQIDSNLELYFNEDGGYYEVRCKHPVSGKPYLVLTAQELDGRIIDRMHQIRDPQYNFAKELEADEAAMKKELEHKRKEQVGEVGERLAHAIRKDLHIKTNF